MRALARLIFESSLLDPFWAALAAGYATVGLDGQMYLTNAGSEYLEGQAAE
jgi:hypothetical protein